MRDKQGRKKALKRVGKAEKQSLRKLTPTPYGDLQSGENSKPELLPEERVQTPLGTSHFKTSSRHWSRQNS